MKVAGHAMLYTLMILLLVGSLIGMYIWHYALQGNWLRQQQLAEQRTRQLEAGIYTYLAQENGRTGQFSYDIEGKKCEVHASSWGLFQLVTAKVDSQRKSCLVGEKAFPIRKHSLWVADQRSPLALAGTAGLRGELYLPQSGLRTAYIAGRGFEGKQLYVGRTGLSEQKGSGYSGAKCWELRPLLEEVLSMPSNGEKLLLTDTKLQRGWDEAPYEFRSQGSLVLGKVELKGAITVVVRDTLWVSEAALLDHTLLIARHIVVSAGFAGRVQALGLGSVRVEEGARLQYPSGVLVAPPARMVGQVWLADNCQLEGYLLASRDILPSSMAQHADLVSIAQTAEVWGTLDTNLPLDLRGSVFGSIQAQQLVVALPSQRYRHTLLDGRVDRALLDRQFVGPMVYGGGLFRVIEWW